MPRLLRFRFRLRTLLIAAALLPVLLAWFVDWWQSGQNFQMLTTGSRAMEPFFNGRAIKVVDMNAYRTAKPKRWEAVAFRLRQPTQAGRMPTARILRVIGLPGETVTFSDGRIVVDGEHLETPRYGPPHLHDVRYHSHLTDVEVLPHPYTVPDRCYYLLGDNPDVASDSRIWGAIPQADILGRYPARPNERAPYPWPQICATILFLTVPCWLLLSRRNITERMKMAT